jgi:hypothetical protein
MALLAKNKVHAKKASAWSPQLVSQEQEGLDATPVLSLRGHLARRVENPVIRVLPHSFLHAIPMSATQPPVKAKQAHGPMALLAKNKVHAKKASALVSQEQGAFPVPLALQTPGHPDCHSTSNARSALSRF